MVDAPIQPEASAMMNALADRLNNILKPWGFALLVFPLNEPIDGRVNYISNGTRDTMIVALKELLARWEGRVPETRETH